MLTNARPNSDGHAASVRSADRRAIRALPTRAVSATVRRCAFYRRSLTQSALIAPYSDAHYQARLAQHVDRLPALSDHDRDVLRAMTTSGVAVCPIQLSSNVIDATNAVMDRLRGPHGRVPCVQAELSERAEDMTVFAHGLAPHLLDMAENHLGLSPRYLGVELKRELIGATSRQHDAVRRWHLDHEDRRIFKVIVYLSDVTCGTGPFGHIDWQHTQTIADTIKHRYQPVSDEHMAAIVSRDQWHQVTGPRLTAVYVDTGRVYHRVFPPTEGERYSVSFAYSSHNPYYTYSKLLLPQAALRRLCDGLSPRQRASLKLNTR
jgi:hypothetical protein